MSLLILAVIFSAGTFFVSLYRAICLFPDEQCSPGNHLSVLSVTDG